MHVMHNVDLQRVRVQAEERIKTITPQKKISFFSKNFSEILFLHFTRAHSIFTIDDHTMCAHRTPHMIQKLYIVETLVHLKK